MTLQNMLVRVQFRGFIAKIRIFRTHIPLLLINFVQFSYVRLYTFILMVYFLARFRWTQSSTQIDRNSHSSDETVMQIPMNARIWWKHFWINFAGVYYIFVKSGGVLDFPIVMDEDKTNQHISQWNHAAVTTCHKSCDRTISCHS